jgi:hypothetical protein
VQDVGHQHSDEQQRISSLLPGIRGQGVGHWVIKRKAPRTSEVPAGGASSMCWRRNL